MTELGYLGPSYTQSSRKAWLLKPRPLPSTPWGALFKYEA